MFLWGQHLQTKKNKVQQSQAGNEFVDNGEAETKTTSQWSLARRRNGPKTKGPTPRLPTAASCRPFPPRGCLRETAGRVPLPMTCWPW